MKILAPRGTADILPKDQEIWSKVTSTCKLIASEFSYDRIDTPLFENTELFKRGVGDQTDIVQKEMYTFKDHSGESITLKPEGTASICRSYLQNGLSNSPLPVRLYYISPMFRYERPQAGRLRQHHQFGCEAIGDPSPQVDAEIIELGWTYISRLGLKNIDLRINSIGDLKNRALYIKELKKFLMGHKNKLPKIDQERLIRSPLRVLDSKEEVTVEITKNAPKCIDYLQNEDLEHWKELIEFLNVIKDTDKQFDYYIDHSLVRGLDYYNRTVFEFQPRESTSQGTILAGGRYDPLIEKIGGPVTPGVGFGSGIERMILEIKKQINKTHLSNKADIIIIHIGETTKKSYAIASKLRRFGISTVLAPKRSVKAQMRYANNINAKFVLIIGEKEIKSGKAQFKSLHSNIEDFEIELKSDLIAKKFNDFQKINYA